MKKIVFALLIGFFAAHALAFSFSEDESRQSGKQQAAAAKQRAGASISPACKDALRGKTVMVVIGERTARGMSSEQSAYSSHFQAIDRRFKRLGLNTISQADMKAKIAQAEINAYLNNDMDAALNASKKMGTDFILRGVMSSRSAINPVLGIPEVYVSMRFTLNGADGRIYSEAGASAESYSGTNTGSMALTLINEQADGVVARLYRDYCSAVGIGGRRSK